MRTHLKRKTCRKSKGSKNVSSRSLLDRSPRRSKVQTEFDRDIVKHFANSMISLRCTDDPYFQQILSRLNLGIMSRRTLEEESALVKQELNYVKHVWRC